MVRGIVVGFCSALLLLVGGTGALACDTASWLQVSGTVGPGATVTVRGGGLEPGPLTLVWDRPGGRAVASGSVSADGRLTVDAAIPADAAGRHTIIAVPAGGAEASPVDSHAWTDVVVPVAATGPRSAPVTAQAAVSSPAVTAEIGLALVAVGLAVLGFLFRHRRTAAAASVGSAGRDDDLDGELTDLLEGRAPERSPCAAGHVAR